MTTVTITGATGFVGRQVVRALSRPDVSLRLGTHRRSVKDAPPGSVVQPIDLAVPGSLAGFCDGADVLIHCASMIGGTAAASNAVNVEGTRSLLQVASKAGVSRVIYLSTASVYGRGVYRNASPEELAPAPLSVASRTRLAAEQLALAAGGVVVRPYLVYGDGDRWVIPGLVKLLGVLQADVDGWPARVSMVDVEDLARGLAGLALAPAPAVGSAIYHGGHPLPVPVVELMQAVSALLPRDSGTPASLTYGEACSRLTAVSGSTHALDMIATDHWFESASLWRDTACDPGPGFADRFPRSLDWYRRD
jgi:nucleoside-diphosphate-sugar epimerase